MDKEQTSIGSDSNPAAPSTAILNRTRRRWWGYNGALAPLWAQTART